MARAFFDAITVDAWYTKGPFLRAVQKLGWGVVAVLKQERFEVYQETTALTQPQGAPALAMGRPSRRPVEVKDLSFTEVRGPVRVVVAEENWWRSSKWAESGAARPSTLPGVGWPPRNSTPVPPRSSAHRSSALGRREPCLQ